MSIVVNFEQRQEGLVAHAVKRRTGCSRRETNLMKPEELLTSQPGGSDAKSETSGSHSNTVESQVTAHAVAEKKTSSAFKPQRRTTASMRLAKLSKRASHRRQIRRSHANG